MTTEGYNQIQFELGILDDDEDWELYKEQEKRYDIDEIVEKYLSNSFTFIK